MIVLDGDNVTIKEIEKVLFQSHSVKASDESWNKVKSSRKVVEDITDEGKVVYGVTTGFGKMSDVLIDSKDTEKLQLNLIRNHSSGVGEPFSEVVSRAMLLLRANTLLKGFSGVRPKIIEQLIMYINKRITPIIPQQGSLGASGDLAPLAHLALTLIGEGKVYYKGQKMETIDVLKEEKIEPLTLTAKEGLGLINGTQAMTAQGIVAYIKAEKLCRQVEMSSSLTFEALSGITDVFDERIHAVRGYNEQIEVAKRMSTYLAESKLTTRQGELRVQDAYSLRCIPQVHGATWQTLNYVKEKLEIEINAATDNPLIFDNGNNVISGGNFHGQPIALAMDFLCIAMAEIANITERRIERLVNPQLNDLPPFLTPDPGLQSGAMILQITAASLVSENKTLAHPASVDSIPSSGNQEDHVSMGTIGARHANQIVDNVRNVVAIELMCAMQACEFKGKEKMSSYTRVILEKGREIIDSMNQDRVFAYDIEKINEWLLEGNWDDFLVN